MTVLVSIILAKREGILCSFDLLFYMMVILKRERERERERDKRLMM